MIRKWLPILKRLKFENVLKQLPEEERDIVETEQIHPVLERYQRKIATVQTLLVAGTRGFKAEVLSASKAGRFMRKSAVRFRTPKKVLKHADVHAFVKSIVTEAWISANPLTKGELLHSMLRNFKEGPFFDLYFKDVQGNYKKAYMFITRSLNLFGYTLRKKTISQKIPIDWRQRSEEGAKRCRDKMLAENVDVLISSDETFMKFHESGSMVLAPVGAKRIGSALKIKEKEGCTVMVSIEMFSSRLLPPFVIFKGVFGATLMTKWQDYKTSAVLFTENHWMTAETNILYLQYLLDMYDYKKRIGLIYDHAPSHVCAQVKLWVENYNLKAENCCKIFIEFIDPCLTSIYQPPDVVMNAPLKAKIRT